MQRMPTWALVFIVRHKQYDRRGAQDALGAMFDLRHRLIDLTDEGTVIELEAQLPLKKVEHKATSSTLRRQDSPERFHSLAVL